MGPSFRAAQRLSSTARSERSPPVRLSARDSASPRSPGFPLQRPCISLKQRQASIRRTVAPAAVRIDNQQGRSAKQSRITVKAVSTQSLSVARPPGKSLRPGVDAAQGPFSFRPMSIISRSGPADEVHRPYVEETFPAGVQSVRSALV
jgi:hypothetical protein